MLTLGGICRQRLAVPRYWLNTYGRRTFSVAGPTVWNSPGHQCRLFQAFAWNVFVRSILGHWTRYRFLTITALYKCTYLCIVQQFVVECCGCRRFVLLCDSILSSSDTGDSQRHFADDFLLPLLSLHGDRVPNVRISLARILAIHSAFFGKYSIHSSRCSCLFLLYDVR